MIWLSPPLCRSAPSLRIKELCGNTIPDSDLWESKIRWNLQSGDDFFFQKNIKPKQKPRKIIAIRYALKEDSSSGRRKMIKLDQRKRIKNSGSAKRGYACETRKGPWITDIFKRGNCFMSSCGFHAPVGGGSTRPGDLLKASLVTALGQQFDVSFFIHILACFSTRACWFEIVKILRAGTCVLFSCVSQELT
ncbi:uncharacterized protein LOC120594938 [Pteropus medius]|uniref:uncharacterized protein LOC120594938 n=1 Tax=Pteropus vampyrus TaxID=132908 RepID=UPI00196A9B0B|nr:uncharacterized protein LOC120594938 [Pteropus giganteus]